MLDNAYKTLKNALVYAAAASMLYACGGGGGSSPSSTQPSQPQPTYGENYISSAYGTSKLIFDNGVVKDAITAATSKGNVDVYVPHNGGTITLSIYNPDDPSSYLYITENGTNAYQINNLSIQSSNASWQDVSCDLYNNEKMIKISHNNQTETAKLYLSMQEGQSISFDNFRVYDVLDQNNVCDLGDYFPTFNVHANDVADVEAISTSQCPINVDGDGNIYVPSSSTCVELSLEDKDSIGSNHQYSLDNGDTWNSFSSPTTIRIDVSNLDPGSSNMLYLKVKEELGVVGSSPIEDTKTYAINIIKELNEGVNAYCIDNVSSNTYAVSDGDSCVFVDPSSSPDKDQKIRFSLNDEGTCDVNIYKDNNLIDQQQNISCSFNYEHVLDPNEKGSGFHDLKIEVYKDYGGNKVLLDSVNIAYRINAAPQISLASLSTLPKEGQNFNELIATCTDPDGDSVSMSTSSLPYGFSYSDDGNGNLSLSANPVPYELPDGTSLVNHLDPDGDGRWDTLTQQIGVYCSDGIDTTQKTMDLVVRDSNRRPVITSPQPTGTYKVGEIIYYDMDCEDPDKEDNANIVYYYIPEIPGGPDACLDNNPSTICAIEETTGRMNFEVIESDYNRGYIRFTVGCRDPPANSFDETLADYTIQ